MEVTFFDPSEIVFLEVTWRVTLQFEHIEVPNYWFLKDVCIFFKISIFLYSAFDQLEVVLFQYF